MTTSGMSVSVRASCSSVEGGVWGPFTCLCSVACCLIICPWARVKVVTTKLVVNVRLFSSKRHIWLSLAGTIDQ